MSVKRNKYQPDNVVLWTADHWVGTSITVNDSTTGVITENGKKLIKMGTVLPANDSTAIGIVLSTVDVTDGSAHVTLVEHGFVDVSKMVTAPSKEAKTALKLIIFKGE